MSNAGVKIPSPATVLGGVWSASLRFDCLLGGVMKFARRLLWALSCCLKDWACVAVLFTTLLVTED